MKNDTTRICLWSGPRNISTALMYSFAQRTDTKVYDEPLYGYYLANSDAKKYHPGAEEVINSMTTDGKMVIKMMLEESSKPVVFFKHMTHHLLDLDRSFLKNFKNIILTRDPVEMLPSYAKVINHPTIDDVGYALHLQLLNNLKEMNIKPLVIDSKSILINPGEQLKKLCTALDIPFEENMLSWKPGARPEDGIWAQYWYRNVHLSSGFDSYTPKTDPFPQQLQNLLNECKPYYDQLMKHTL